MEDKGVRYHGLSYAALGYIFININFHIGRIQLLPDFVGYLFLLCAISILFQERRDLLLLRPLCIILMVIGIINWILAFAGEGVGGHIMFFDLLVTAVTLYFYFQFLTDIAALAQTCPKCGKKMAVRLRFCRTVCTLLNTVIAVVSFMFWNVRLEDGRIYARGFRYLLLLIGLMVAITTLVIIVTLFGLRKRFRNMEKEVEIGNIT
ncbi:MAG: hypothetical protein K2N63_10650 [Lachnospiraceae bacterium]|nr:hypothetical protein [Lachnospiraceae bacterium]